MLQENNEYLYSVEVIKSENNDESGVYRNPLFPNELISNFHENPLNSVWEIFEESSKEFKDYECLGMREKVNNELGPYKWKTYGEVRELIICAGSGLMNLKTCPLIKTGDDIIKSARFIGIYMANNIEWTILDIACNAYHIITVPLYDSLGVDSSKYILNQTMMEAIVCDTNCAKKLLTQLHTCETIYLKKLILITNNKGNVSTIKDSASSKSISEIKKDKKKEKKEKSDSLKEVSDDVKVVTTDQIDGCIYKNEEDSSFNEIDKEILELNKKYNLEIITWEKLILEGKKKNRDIPQANLDAVASLCYTSGTTGNPKGVIIKNKNFIGAISGTSTGPLQWPELSLTSKDVHLSYLPLAHIYERIFIPTCLFFGMKIGYYSGNVQALLDDMQVLKPTIFASVPRLFNRIYEKIFLSLKKKSTIVQSLVNKAIDQKLKKINTTGQVTHMIWDKLLFNKMKKLLGGNIRFLLNGSAPINSDVLKKLKVFFCAPFLEAYGMTETMGGIFVSWSYDTEAGHIGGPLPNTEFKLVSVPEMNYLVTDDPPRGELLLRGSSICTSGYFKLKKETDEVLQPDGFIATGDVVLLNKNGSITIIDRKKNIFKLSQGEYIAVEKIEALYQQSLFISQIFVFGYSHESFLVCVICLSEDALNYWRRDKTCDKDDDEIIASEEFKKDVLNDMMNIGKQQGLKGYEQVKNIHFAKEQFTIDNQLLTPTGKLKRHAVFMRYKSEIDKMYEEAKNASFI